MFYTALRKIHNDGLKIVQHYEEVTAAYEELEATHEELTATEEELRQQYDVLMARREGIEWFKWRGWQLVKKL